MSKPITLSRVLQQIGSASHVFHAACHHDPGLTERNGVRGHDHGLEAGAADLVDRHGTDRLGDSRSDRCLSGRSLAKTGAEDATHIDVIHTLWPKLIRFKASAMATLPNLVAGTGLNTPLKLPIGVRTALTMTACVLCSQDLLPMTVFKIALHLCHELIRRRPIDDPVVERQAQIAHRSDRNGVVDDDEPVSGSHRRPESQFAAGE